jgi:hypothetical protein
MNAPVTSLLGRRADVMRHQPGQRQRDQREATDTRTEIERWLGHPPRNRSANKTAAPLGDMANKL